MFADNFSRVPVFGIEPPVHRCGAFILMGHQSARVKKIAVCYQDPLLVTAGFLRVLGSSKKAGKQIAKPSDVGSGGTGVFLTGGKMNLDD
ncbi:hypothetical protein ACNKHR_24235 [Shigella flexneri]